MIEEGNMIRNQPAKMRYMWRDVERRAAKNGVPFVKPPIWPTDPINWRTASESSR